MPWSPPPGLDAHASGAETSTDTRPPAGVFATSPPVAARPRVFAPTLAWPAAFATTIGVPRKRHADSPVLRSRIATPLSWLHCRATVGCSASRDEVQGGALVLGAGVGSGLGNSELMTAGVAGSFTQGMTRFLALAVPSPRPSAPVTIMAAAAMLQDVAALLMSEALDERGGSTPRGAAVGGSHQVGRRELVEVIADGQSLVRVGEDESRH